MGDAVLHAPCAEISLLASDQNRRCQACCRSEPWLPAECVSDLVACRVASAVPSLMKSPRIRLKGEPSSSEMTLYGKLTETRPPEFLDEYQIFPHRGQRASPSLPLTMWMWDVLTGSREGSINIK